MKISYYRNKADRLLQEKMKEKNQKCEICNKPVFCHHHFHTKASSSALRYEEENLIPVCASCHLGFHSSRVAFYTSVIIAKRGISWSNNLLKKKSKIIKVNISYYKDIIENLEKR